MLSGLSGPWSAGSTTDTSTRRTPAVRSIVCIWAGFVPKWKAMIDQPRLRPWILQVLPALRALKIFCTARLFLFHCRVAIGWDPVQPTAASDWRPRLQTSSFLALKASSLLWIGRIWSVRLQWACLEWNSFPSWWPIVLIGELLWWPNLYSNPT